MNEFWNVVKCYRIWHVFSLNSCSMWANRTSCKICSIKIFFVNFSLELFYLIVAGILRKTIICSQTIRSHGRGWNVCETRRTLRRNILLFFSCFWKYNDILVTGVLNVTTGSVATSVSLKHGHPKQLSVCQVNFSLFQRYFIFKQQILSPNSKYS